MPITIFCGSESIYSKVIVGSGVASILIAALRWTFTGCLVGLGSGGSFFFLPYMCF